MKVKVGIPNDWKTLSVFELADKQKSQFDDGDWIEAEHISNKGVRLIQTGNIGVGCFIEKDAKKYVYESSFDLLKCKELEVGDLLICRLAEPAGRACILPDIDENKVITAVDVTIFRPKKEKFDRGYLVQYFSTPQWFEVVLEQVGGTTHKRISRSALGGIKIPIPSSVAEQRAIATALGDVDALLSGLDKLIAKKRDIKQAAMQQLLTGKTRLPGFDGEWVVKRLGDVAYIKTGSRNNEDKVEDGEYPFFVRSDDIERINSYSHDCEAILVPGEGRIGEIFHYINGKFNVHQRVYAITRFAPDVSGHFVYLYMKAHFGTWAMKNTVKATVDSLRLPTFQNFLMRMPPTLEEQTASAEVLKDMDAELAALEARRDKTRALKTAMMQELLTGKTRLV
ncbi:MAG: restriction endonuclease subunit S [Candidatus Accumulibacter sp.]|jgi:type I restriction enzyme S subunit|nr:restriction endonuclease subunit S [Accumulibacter sp.]